ncbi:MAG TPA: M17 family peptidase N-terminal domain-containing protein, partial [Ktedonobacteraceae bacterium]
MDIRIIEQSVEDMQCDALVVGAAYKKVGQQAKELVLAGKATEVDSLLGGLIQAIYDVGEFKAELGELITLHPMGKLAAKRIVVLGLGAQEKMNTQSIRRASAIATRHLQQTGAYQVALTLHSKEWNMNLDNSVRAEVEGAVLGLYTFKKYKQTNANGNGRGITSIDLLANNANDAMLDLAV